jgi:hypothetical protein
MRQKTHQMFVGDVIKESPDVRFHYPLCPFSRDHFRQSAQRLMRVTSRTESIGVPELRLCLAVSG